jgi:arylformamidase
MEYTAAFVEREYNNRALVPDYQDYFDRWERDSDFVRATLPGTLDLAYGLDPRQRIDIFPARKGSERLLVFIHGGYWRGLDKRMFAWIAPSWVAADVSVALVGYRLCPQVRIPDIVDDVIAATNWIFAHGGAHGAGTGRVVVSGHSAGGHLTGALFAAPRNALAFDIERLAGGVPISGLFDFEPLPLFSGNAELRLDRDSAKRLDLYDKTPTIPAPLVVAVGGRESDEFKRQSRVIAEAWKPQVREHLVLPDLHHFSVVDAFAERGNPLYEGTLALFK